MTALFLLAIMVVHFFRERCTYLILVVYGAAHLAYNSIVGPDFTYLVLGYAAIDVATIIALTAKGDADIKGQVLVLSMFILIHFMVAVDLYGGYDLIHSNYVESCALLYLMHVLVAFGGMTLDWLAARKRRSTASDNNTVLAHLRRMDLLDDKW